MNDRRRRIPAIQWTTAAAGALLVLATLAFLAYSALEDTGDPPDIRISHDPPVPVAGGFLLQVHVHNAGDRTAADLRIAGSLSAPTATAHALETADITFDDVPPGATRHGGLLFTRNPAEFTITLTARSYTTP